MRRLAYSPVIGFIFFLTRSRARVLMAAVWSSALASTIVCSADQTREIINKLLESGTFGGLIKSVKNRVALILQAAL